MVVVTRSVFEGSEPEGQVLADSEGWFSAARACRSSGRGDGRRCRRQDRRDRREARSSVLLPEPLAPVTAMTCPSSSTKDRSCRIVGLAALAGDGVGALKSWSRVYLFWGVFFKPNTISFP